MKEKKNQCMGQRTASTPTLLPCDNLRSFLHLSGESQILQGDPRGHGSPEMPQKGAPGAREVGQC